MMKLADLPGAHLLDTPSTEKIRNAECIGMDRQGRPRWKPFWQRGHTTLDEIAVAERKNRKWKKIEMKKARLYHSTFDLSLNRKKSSGVTPNKSKLGKSVSMQCGLHTLDNNIRNNARQTCLSNLTLPKLDITTDVDSDVMSRDISAAGTDINARVGTNSATADEQSDEGENDVYLSDDDPAVSRQNLDKAGDYIVDHDWILKEKLLKEKTRMKTKHIKLRVLLPDEDPMEGIKSRLDEISMMVKPRPELGSAVMSQIDPEQREIIMKYKHADYAEIRRQRRKNYTPLKRFRDAASYVILLYKASQPRRRYLLDEKPDVAPDGVKKIKEKTQDADSVPKSSLGLDMQLALITQPHLRTKTEVKRVIQILRATKAFKQLFPAQLEEQLAKVVSYERYDTRRIVAQQGRMPERFYYILTGTLSKVREYRLMSGVVTREEAVIEKGNTTDPLEMKQKWPREHHLVTKGAVEVLIMERNDFLTLQHTCQGPPIDFLQRLDLFKEFPCEEFLVNPDALDFRYYGEGKIIVNDTNRTPWLHVVKTGSMKVVRGQTVVDVQNESKFVSQSTEELGCVRPFSHAGAMLGLLANQRKMKSFMGSMTLSEEPEEADDQITRRHRKSEQISNGEDGQRRHHSPTKKSKMSSFTVADGDTNGMTDVSIVQELSDNYLHPGTSRLPEAAKHTNNSNDRSGPSSSDKTLFLPPINGSRQAERIISDFVPHGTYLTREKTDVESIYNKRKKPEVVTRTAYLQLDVLTSGDIFGLSSVSEQFKLMYPIQDEKWFQGLEHLEPQALASESQGLTLVSNGAEIIKISKRFFLAHAQNNTMLKVDTMQREYMTTDEAKTIMYEKETWSQYKTVLLQRTVNTLHRNQVDRVP